MTALILDGKVVAEAVKAEVSARVAALRRVPGLATVLVGDDPASRIYVKGKHSDAAEVGMRSIQHDLPAETAQGELEQLIENLNGDDDVDGILVQLPLPEHLAVDAVLDLIDPAKDVDGLHPINLGRLMLGREGLRPCTPSAVIRMLGHYDIPISGARAVIVGRSFLVGRPLANMLSRKGVDATVTIAHSRTPDLESLTSQADILVAAVGVARTIGDRHVKPGATVIDVGINRVDGRLVGDVAFGPVSEIAGAISPVPGGVGPMTRALLMQNTIEAAELRAH